MEIWGGLKQPLGFPGGSDDKESACSAGDLGSIPRSGGSPGEGNGYPLQYSCLENSMDRGARQAAVHGDCKKSDMTERLTLFFFSLKPPLGLATSQGNPSGLRHLQSHHAVLRRRYRGKPLKGPCVLWLEVGSAGRWGCPSCSLTPGTQIRSHHYRGGPGGCARFSSWA